jgi:hypothetical protein
MSILPSLVGRGNPAARSRHDSFESMEKLMRPVGSAGLEAWRRVDLRGRREVENTNHACVLEVLEEMEALAWNAAEDRYDLREGR